MATMLLAYSLVLAWGEWWCRDIFHKRYVSAWLKSCGNVFSYDEYCEDPVTWGNTFVHVTREQLCEHAQHGPLAGYVKLRAAHVPGMPETIFPPPRVNDSDIHHGTCVTHVPWCMSGFYHQVAWRSALLLVTCEIWPYCFGPKTRIDAPRKPPMIRISNSRRIFLKPPFISITIWHYVIVHVFMYVYD